MFTYLPNFPSLLLSLWEATSISLPWDGPGPPLSPFCFLFLPSRVHRPHSSWSGFLKNKNQGIFFSLIKSLQWIPIDSQNQFQPLLGPSYSSPGNLPSPLLPSHSGTLSCLHLCLECSSSRSFHGWFFPITGFLCRETFPGHAVQSLSHFLQELITNWTCFYLFAS